ncbi:MAG: gliding motility-associated C-terminal domain-containing protein [Bacteroidales bacterium]|nr:gliding motility-associated C-terminal domain-containing protein [Bacteroidales bacterium]MCF8334681.1 gliding motility-associated C-terminal domain-containing protein [Bacteroidales bacterium]
MARNAYTCPDTAVYADTMLFKGLYVPNAFSPENPGQGARRFKPVGRALASYHARVFDLKGNLLWESRALNESGEPAEGWDGTFRGAPMPQGVYVWKISARFSDGTVWQGESVGRGSDSPGQTYGTVVLIR